ncbi:MAG: rhodanese-like domain-containing protein [Eubacteriales bacterium]|nr:rhodanese-like domain-containing protein [Eubacteriales bacterium]
MEEQKLYRKTPLMGWASWNCFRTHINEELIKKQMDALVDTGLADCGYIYANIDDGFFGGRASDGRLMIHKERFPNGIKVLADYAHEIGLKAGIYSDAGDKTCGFYYDNEGGNGLDVGLYGHEEQDLNMYLDEFGFDFIKVDWCGGVRLGLDEEEQYSKIGRIVDEIRHRTNRCLVYNICRWQFPGPWAAQVADSWRTGADIAPDFASVLHQIDNIKPLARYCSPGHVNDLDMMQIGNGLSLEEEKTHFSMWCMMSTPLMLGCDLTQMRRETLEIVKNRELIAINQDEACLQAYPIKEFRAEDGTLLGEIWIKDLGQKTSNKKAIAFLNRSKEPLQMKISWKEAGLAGKIKSVRNLWRHEECPCAEEIVLTVAAKDAEIYRVTSERALEVADPWDRGEIQKKELKKISMEYALQLAAEGGVLVDVRSREEFQKKHLEGAINLPYCDVHGIAEKHLKDKKQAIIVYCATGKRSSQSVNSLVYLGYENVYYLGGIGERL